MKNTERWIYTAIIWENVIDTSFTIDTPNHIIADSHAYIVHTIQTTKKSKTEHENVIFIKLIMCTWKIN